MPYDLVSYDLGHVDLVFQHYKLSYINQKFDIFLNAGIFVMGFVIKRSCLMFFDMSNSRAKSLGVLLALMLFVGCTTSDKDSSGLDGVSDTSIDFDANGSDSGSIVGLVTVNFEYDQYTLTPETMELLDKNVEWIQEKGNVTLQLEGHCDSRGSSEYNLALGERRAEAVKNYLVKKGISSDILNTISYGEEKLLTEGDTEYDHNRNRRVNFVPTSN